MTRPLAPLPMRAVDFGVLPSFRRPRSASAASAAARRYQPLCWPSKVGRNVVAAAADGADSTDDRGSVLDPRAYPDRPGSRSPLAADTSAHGTERMVACQPARFESLRSHASVWATMVCKRGCHPSVERTRSQAATICAGSPARRGASSTVWHDDRGGERRR
jgi:hypothetical protein